MYRMYIYCKSKGGKTVDLHEEKPNDYKLPTGKFCTYIKFISEGT